MSGVVPISGVATDPQTVVEGLSLGCHEPWVYVKLGRNKA